MCRLCCSRSPLSSPPNCCSLNAIPDPWPMAKIAIDMEKPAQWVTKMCRLYFADIYARRTEGIPKAYPAPGVEATLQEVQQFLPDLEAKMIEFLAEWIVTLLSPATQIVKARAPHLTFMFVKEYWFREFYLGLKVTASLGREESYTRIIDGQVRCITQEHIQKRGQLIWNVEFLTIFVPAWMIPPIYHSLRRECIKNAAHSHPYGVRSIRPTWFKDSKLPSQPDRGDPRAFQPMHGLKLVIKEDVMPQEQMPHFPALEKLAANGFLSVETWNNKRAMLNFKATVEVPMLGTMIESCGDTLDKSHTGEAPTPSPKIMSVSGAKNEPKKKSLFLACLRDDNLPLSNMLMKESKACKRGASRLGEAWPRPRLGRKTYWHKDKARLTGTGKYIILLLKSQQS